MTALRFDPRGLTLAVGTSTGHVALYDIRRQSPLLIKDHQYGLPILDLKYHTGHEGGAASGSGDVSLGSGDGMVGGRGHTHLISTDAKSIRIWSKDTGKTYTTIEPPADVNDVAIFPGSGMLFAALETERLGAYFVPSLGPAPKWCHFLDGLTEEMEEAKETQVGLYDDYKFVTKEDLQKLSLESLIGTNALRPYMHGFFIDSRVACEGRLVIATVCL